MKKIACILVIGLLVGVVGCSTMPAGGAESAGNAERGEALFSQALPPAPACSNCHAAAPSMFAIGPTLQGIGGRAGARVAGQTAEAYLRASILHPRDHIVAGFRNIMYAEYADVLTEQDIRDLIAYLQTL
ncbi:MAG: c-type cytochrome [bacterium]|nr:c-type cytochrome [bacterium]